MRYRGLPGVEARAMRTAAARHWLVVLLTLLSPLVAWFAVRTIYYAPSAQLERATVALEALVTSLSSAGADFCNAACHGASCT